MAYGFNQSFGMGSYDPNGFQGRASGTYVKPTFFNQETGRIQNTPFVPGATQPATSTPTYQGMPPSGMDFFSQLAGLVGGGMGPAPVQAPPTAWFAGGRTDLPSNVDPQMLRVKQAFYGGPVNRLPGGIPLQQGNSVLQQMQSAPAPSRGPVRMPQPQNTQFAGQGAPGAQEPPMMRPGGAGPSSGFAPSRSFAQPASRMMPSAEYGASDTLGRSGTRISTGGGSGSSYQGPSMRRSGTRIGTAGGAGPSYSESDSMGVNSSASSPNDMFAQAQPQMRLGRFGPGRASSGRRF